MGFCGLYGCYMRVMNGLLHGWIIFLELEQHCSYSLALVFGASLGHKLAMVIGRPEGRKSQWKLEREVRKFHGQDD